MKKKVKQYTLDELGELIIPHRLTDKEAKEISAAIKEDKERNKLKKATPFKLKIPSVFSEVKKPEQVFSLDDLLEQIGPRPITKTDERIFSEAIRKYKKAHSALSDKKNLHRLVTVNHIGVLLQKQLSFQNPRLPTEKRKDNQIANFLPMLVSACGHCYDMPNNEV